MAKSHRNKHKRPGDQKALRKRVQAIDLKKEMEEKMEQYFTEMAKSNSLRTYRKERTPIISIDVIRDLFNTGEPSKLKLSLEADMDTFRTPDDEWQIKDMKIADLEVYVQTQACRLYAVLQLSGQPQLIIKLYKEEHRVTDKIFQKGESKNALPYCSRDYLFRQPILRTHADEIFKCQWYIPPILGEDSVPTFPPEHFRFPFITKGDFIDKGGFANVFKLHIAPGHLECKSYDKGSVVAHKEVHKGDLKDASLMREISTIRARPHANIVKIFAGFFAGRENPWHEKDYEQSLHILFEHTDGGNMRNWLELSEASQPPMDNATRRQHIIDTIEGLVHAVMCIHRTFKTHVGYHHDLKPANILLFPTPSPIWKICDFGMANLKHSDDSETTHNDQKGFGTYTYQPPEYFSSGSPSGHGRPFDVWSLGCIILELLTVWHFGWAETGIATFRQWRKENTELASPNRSKLGQSATDDCSFHNNFNVVKKWIAHLSEKGSKDNEFLQVLGLVSEMLVEDKNARIFIWEVYMDLYEMVNPDMTAQELKEHYRTNVVQPSVKSLNGISTGHNPLVRAKGLGKGWQVEVLSNSQNQWFDGKPEQTDTLKNLPRRSTGLYYSTLSGCQQTHDFDRTDFYGRHDMDVKISEGFRELNCVGLYGMSGIGKSHLAYHYVVRFRDTDQEEHKKHTFWVEAGTMARLQETVDNIAKLICPNVTTPNELIKSLQSWLADASNGPWIMVIDGVDDLAVARRIEQLLPKDSGQVLITTKDRAILDSLSHVSSKQRKKACLHMGSLPTSEARLVFQWYNDNLLPNDTGIDALLESVPSPALIKLLATYAANNNKSTSDVLAEIQEARKHGRSLKIPEAVYTDFSHGYFIFEALGAVRSVTGPSDKHLRLWPSPEFELLGSMSCLNKDDMSFELIAQDYAKEGRLRELLGSLENCSFITRGKEQCYFMHETVQDLASQWILDKMGLPSLLDRQQRTLCMLFLLYDKERKSKFERGDRKVRRSSYLWKLPFMPHFDRFLGFTREFGTKLDTLASSNFECHDNMVHAVITFSYMYMEEGRYEDAVCVLEFVYRLYKGFSSRLQLARHMCKAYTVSPRNIRDTDKWLIASQILQSALNIYRSQVDKSRDRREEWLCLLDLIHLHCKFGRPKSASKVLAELKELTLSVHRGIPNVYWPGRKSFANESTSVRLRLAIYKRVAEGRIHEAKADHAIGSAQTRLYQSAREAFSDARMAIHYRFDNDEEDKWESEVNEELARVLCKMGYVETITEAVSIYEGVVKTMQKDLQTSAKPFGETKLWGLKCRKANAQLRLREQLSPGEIEKILDTMRKALAHCEKRFGKTEGQHDERTLDCAQFLMEAYEKCSRHDDVRQVREKYSLHMNFKRIPELVDSEVLMSRWCMALGCLGMLAALVLHKLSGSSLLEI